MATNKKKPPSFFCVLLDDFTHTLKLPCEFVKEHRDELTGKLVLETEGSAEYSWVVEMKKMDEEDGYFLKMGWSDFVQDNNLGRGDFLLFWLISYSTFFVTIYDPSCCEKLWDTSIPSSPNQNISRDEEIVRTEEKTNGGNVEENCEFVGRDEEIVRTEEETNGTGNVEDNCDLVGGDEAIGSTEEENNAINTTKPRCECTITKYTRYRLNLPIGFMRETGMLLEEQSIVLRDKEGREWNVDLCHRHEYRFELTKGWKDFLEGNGIRISDVCSFEYCRDKGNLIDVRVVNGTQMTEGPTQIATRSNTSFANTSTRSTKRKRSALKTKNPWFTNTINKSDIYSLRLPTKFVKETGLVKKKHVVLRDEEGRTWEMKTGIKHHGLSYELNKGWNEFRKANGLQRGDVYSFEFCRDEGNLIDFHVVCRNGGRRKPFKRRTR